jgi:hypothetical protein
MDRPNSRPPWAWQLQRLPREPRNVTPEFFPNRSRCRRIDWY